MMTEQEILEYVDYALSMLEHEIEIYKVALKICDFQTAKSEVWHIEEKCNYLEMNTRAYRDKLRGEE